MDLDPQISCYQLKSVHNQENLIQKTNEVYESKKPLADRTVLGNLTNRLREDFAHQTYIGSQSIPIHKNSKLLSTEAECSSLVSTALCPLSHSDFSSTSCGDSGYRSIHTESIIEPSKLTSNSLTQSLICPKSLNSKQFSKRPRYDESDSTFQAQVSCVDDDSDDDRRPFKSKLACDIVRAAFADRVQLEELLAECRRADFAISAIDRSPVDRMMEATDYIVGIMAYEQTREAKEDFQVSDFLAAGKQPNLSADMLTTLADWLVEVQENFALNHETIHLAWGLLYAFLDRGQPLARREIQLMACAAIMVACKHEERQMSHLNEFLYITDNAYTKEEFIEAERRLLNAIDFAVHRPNPYVFLRRYARVLDAHSGPVQFTSRFLLEAGMHSHAISLKRESRKAAAVLWLARVVLRNPAYADWTRRADVHQLRQLIQNNPLAQAYYAHCRSQKSKINHNNNARSRLTQFVTPTADLTTYLSATNSCDSESFQSKFAEKTPYSLSTGSDNSDESSNDGKCMNFSKLISAPHSTPSSHNHLASTSVMDSFSENSTFDGLDPSIKSDLEAMRLEEEQRQPLWPPILEHITGYKEASLIPLALRYHAIALRLIAEVARGGRLAVDTGNKSDMPTNLSVKQNNSESVQMTEFDVDDPSNPQNSRCVSPGGHYLRRQSVTKYCSSAFLSVADAYPQLAFDNFVPYFPSIQCPETCTCFVCANLIRRSN
ncbi:G2/mitotic-specific cyclin-B3 [Schistosoma japonicum]|nr:G2/mitotic-specific cyclin-B3 [Schistosoma japonicum]